MPYDLSSLKRLATEVSVRFPGPWSECDGELCISIDGQLAIKPIGANLISLSAGQIG